MGFVKAAARPAAGVTAAAALGGPCSCPGLQFILLPGFVGTNFGGLKIREILRP